MYNIPDRAIEIAREILPGFDRWKQGVKKLMARNMMQVLGKDLNTPSDFLICWTPGGELKGGTRAAITLAFHNNVSIYNLAIEGDQIKLSEYLKNIGGQPNG